MIPSAAGRYWRLNDPFAANAAATDAAKIANAFEWPGQPPKLPFPLGFRHPAGEDRATDIGNMRRKIGKDRACGSGDMLVDRQTDRQSHRHTHTHTHTHTETCLSQYFAAPEY